MLTSLMIDAIYDRIIELVGHKLNWEEQETLRSFLSTFKLPDAIYIPMEEDDLAVILANTTSEFAKTTIEIVYSLPIEIISQVCIYQNQPVDIRILYKLLEGKGIILGRIKRLSYKLHKECQGVILERNGFIFRRPYPREYRVKSRLIQAVPRFNTSGETILRAYLDRLYISTSQTNNEAELETIQKAEKTSKAQAQRGVE